MYPFLKCTRISNVCCLLRLSCETHKPAITLKFKKGGNTAISVDLVPMIEIKNWPVKLTEEWRTRTTKGEFSLVSVMIDYMSHLISI